MAEQKQELGILPLAAGTFPTCSGDADLSSLPRSALTAAGEIRENCR
jgi:hypothetical protein